MVKITKNGISLSASATANGMPLIERPFLTVGAGDYAERAEGRDRRKVRRARISDKHCFRNSGL
jgi:hypothetical protein